MQRIRRNASLQQEAGGVGRRERRLFGGLGNDGIAGGQRRGDLPGVDRQWKIPRADAAEHALATQSQQVALARGSGQRSFMREIATRARCVVAQEIDRLAHFTNGVRQRLARFAHATRHESGGMFLVQGGGTLQHRRATLATGASQSSWATTAAAIALSTADASAAMQLPICSDVSAGLNSALPAPARD